ncbi:maleylpyruvate isomerase family mycothiol-dependent enzyme [Planosporangium flavigriseum]|uniref:TIGR03083 family protein n=1 Tax=Planosporangium flavigriseum TaxID=373681 RepID=A0A8J3PLW3_9ACTN|nr:maleylpyruvate isomerase family mycothiol-dependent enzyme [Planosporangium flavigriseum]NJC65815.1 maleylpyruvate isomerase family mycothiol-dependent enzyme [Planosporangium flavigriseum]GIG73669.1 hypothetical protein Pfl04_20730 [Planosporangium flavigriseum]
MDSSDYLAQLRREFDAFEACLSGDLSTPIEHCGDWTLYDLADHLGRGNLWAAAAVTEKRGNHQSPPAPRASTELVTWFKGTSAALLTALDTDPATDAWTFFPPHTVGFWQRRRCLETLVHRWDAEHALGIPSEVDPVLAGDGIAEVIDTMVPLQIKRGRLSAPAHPIRFTATDLSTGTGTATGSWILGPGDPITTDRITTDRITADPVATVSGPAAALLLMLWGRLPHDDQAITWDGHRAAAEAALNSPLVP